MPTELVVPTPSRLCDFAELLDDFAEEWWPCVLVTCDADNAASRATIENNGGELEDIRRGKRRYWIE